MSITGTTTTSILDITVESIVRTDQVLHTIDGGYCWTFYDDEDNEVYVEVSAECAQLLRDKLLAVVDDEEWIEEEEEVE